MQMVKMSAPEILAALPIYMAANQPVFIQGYTGGGKTSLVRSFAKAVSLPLIEAPNLSMSESVDFRGIPVTEKRGDYYVTKWARPAWLPMPGTKCILLLDEANMNRALFGALYQIFLERFCGEHEMGKGVFPIALGNYSTEKSIASEFPKALSNRLATIDYVTCPKFFAGALATQIGLHPFVIAFAKYRPDCVHLIPGMKPAETHIPAIPADARAFPTPRSLESLSDIFKAMPKDIAPSLRRALIDSKIGPEIGADMASLITAFESLTPPADIIANPQTAPLPANAGLAYMITSALASMATPANFAAIVTYGKRLADAGQAEFYCTLGLDATRRNPALKETAAYVSWATDNAADIL